jgi:hypothetical protein
VLACILLLLAFLLSLQLLFANGFLAYFAVQDHLVILTARHAPLPSAPPSSLVRAPANATTDIPSQSPLSSSPGMSLNLTSINQDLDCITREGKWTQFLTRPNMARFGVEWEHSCGLHSEADAVRLKRTGAWFAWIPPARCPWLPMSPGCRSATITTATTCDFDRRQFCRALQGRRLLLVGDSTQYLMHNALLSTIFNATKQVQFHDHIRGCMGHELCSNYDAPPSTMKYIRNDLLVGVWAGRVV